MPTLRKYPQDLRIFPDAKAESPTPAPHHRTVPSTIPVRSHSSALFTLPFPAAASPTRPSSAQPNSRPHPFVVSRAAVPGGPCRTTLTPTKPPKQSSLTTHYAQLTPSPSRHPGVLGRHPAATTPAPPSGHPTRPTLPAPPSSSFRTTNHFRSRRPRQSLQAQGQSTSNVDDPFGRMTRRFLRSRLALSQIG